MKVFLRYLSSKSPLSERRLTIASLEVFECLIVFRKSVFSFNLVWGCAEIWKYFYVTSPLNLLSRKGDLPSLRSKFVEALIVFRKSVLSFTLIGGLFSSLWHVIRKFGLFHGREPVFHSAIRDFGHFHGRKCIENAQAHSRASQR